MMGKKILIIFLSFVFATQMSFSKKQDSIQTTNKQVTTTQKTNWQPLIDAIIMVESKGNDKAIGVGGCVGPMQIKMILVQDCNEYLKMKGINKRYTSQDRFNRQKSAEMFKLIMERYNKSNSIQKACYIWNQGCGYSKHMDKAISYYNKVMKYYKGRH